MERGRLIRKQPGNRFRKREPDDVLDPLPWEPRQIKLVRHRRHGGDDLRYGVDEGAVPIEHQKPVLCSSHLGEKDIRQKSKLELSTISSTARLHPGR